MQLIKLTHGKFAIVDDDVVDMLQSLGSWQIGSKGYVTMKKWDGKRYNTLRMHRIVMGLSKFDKRRVDHKNLNKLDNRLRNLRICDDIQNNLNVAKRKIQCTSIFKGVYLRKNRWIASITLRKKRTHLGSFSDEKDAAKAYNKKARELFGSFAYLNNVE